MLILFPGCAAFYDVKVDSRAQPDAKDKIAYYIDDVSAPNERDSLRTKEVEKAVVRALAGRGMYDVPKREMASVVVTVDYGIGPPVMHRESYDEPVMREVIAYFPDLVGTDDNGNPIYRTDAQSEGYEPTGQFRHVVRNSVEYEKKLTLSARESEPNPDSATAPISWEIQVSTEGESKDLRKYLPVLAATAMEHVAEDTEGPVIIRMKDDLKNPDNPANFIRQGMSVAK